MFHLFVFCCKAILRIIWISYNASQKYTGEKPYKCIQCDNSFLKKSLKHKSIQLLLITKQHRNDRNIIDIIYHGYWKQFRWANAIEKTQDNKAINGTVHCEADGFKFGVLPITLPCLKKLYLSLLSIGT